MTIKLGQKVKDKITGFQGVVTGPRRIHQVLVVPPVKEDGSFVDSHWFDEDRVTVVEAEPVKLSIVNPGPDKPAPKR